MASQGQITSFAEFVTEKREDLSKLRDEYEEAQKTEVVACNSKAEAKILHAQYLKLKAEIKVVKDMQLKKKHFVTLPEDPDFLYEWTKHMLKKNVGDLHKTVDEQAKIRKQLLAYETDLQEEIYLSGVVQQIHRKLVKRLRRLARFHLSPDPAPTPSTNSQKSFYKVLKKFIVELEDYSPAATQPKEVVSADESFPKNHIQFLSDCNVIEIINEDPLELCLK